MVNIWVSEKFCYKQIIPLDDHFVQKFSKDFMLLQKTINFCMKYLYDAIDVSVVLRSVQGVWRHMKVYEGV